jgi:hypothetical protein
MVTDLVPLVFSSGWASGVNAYITVFVLGLFARFSDTSVVPDAFGRTDVLVAAGVMVLVELVVDKVPWLDSAWDGISTVIRPVVGGVVAYQLAGDSGTVDQTLLTALGGSTALVSHSVKSGLRLAVNTSPEPFSNIAVSTAEDISVVSVVALAMAHPWVALGVSATLLLIGIVLVVLLLSAIRRARETRRRRRAGTPDPAQ